MKGQFSHFRNVSRFILITLRSTAFSLISNQFVGLKRNWKVIAWELTELRLSASNLLATVGGRLKTRIYIAPLFFTRNLHANKRLTSWCHQENVIRWSLKHFSFLLLHVRTNLTFTERGRRIANHHIHRTMRASTLHDACVRQRAFSLFLKSLKWHHVTVSSCTSSLDVW